LLLACEDYYCYDYEGSLVDEPFCCPPCRCDPEELLAVVEGVFSVNPSYSRFIEVSLSFSDPNHPSAFFVAHEEREKRAKMENKNPPSFLK